MNIACFTFDFIPIHFRYNHTRILNHTSVNSTVTHLYLDKTLEPPTVQKFDCVNFPHEKYAIIFTCFNHCSSVEKILYSLIKDCINSSYVKAIKIVRTIHRRSGNALNES